MRAGITRFALALALAAGLGAAAGCGAAPQEPTVTVLVPWSGTELTTFLNVVQPWENSHHVLVDAETTGSYALQINADQAAGELPDLVDFSEPGAVGQYEEDHELKPLSIDLGSYDQPWRSLAESPDGTVYAVPVKADVKSLIWYKTSFVKGSPASTTWTALENVSRTGTPWCLGLNSGDTSGWPGADWVAEILLSADGAGTYRDWLTGTVSWESPQVRDAWQTWGRLIRYGAAVPGGPEAALQNEYSSAITARGCFLDQSALSATGLASTAGYGYVPFPSISGKPAPLLVSGDFMSLFTDNPNARSLLQYLASDQAQERWVRQPGAHAFSADSAVLPGDYPRGPERSIAGLFQPTASATRCFSAEDIMVPGLTSAFEQDILRYVSDPNSLESLLGGLQKSAKGANDQVAGHTCGLPSPGITGVSRRS
jgi:alpha-glucoside transport system substrate-binding protein